MLAITKHQAVTYNHHVVVIQWLELWSGFGAKLLHTLQNHSSRDDSDTTQSPYFTATQKRIVVTASDSETYMRFCMYFNDKSAHLRAT